jgi:hypothetical protein
VTRSDGSQFRIARKLLAYAEMERALAVATQAAVRGFSR